MSQPESQFAADDAQVRRIFDSEFEEHKSVANVTMSAVRSGFTAALSIMEHSVRQGGKLLIFGNGGSASDAQHIVAELVVRYKSNRAAVAAIALTTDTSILTACGNDLGFDALFERQIEALGRPGDVAIGISTSGKSPNVLRGLRQARSQGLKTVGLTGGTGGEMVGICDAAMTVPTAVTARIQEMHIILGHMLCLALEVRLGLV
jgi:D-sedoheptulose 7-phosphate isomerase